MTPRVLRRGAVFQLVNGIVPLASGELRCCRGHWTLRNGWVSPLHRGNGYQRRLIRARVRYACQLGAKRVRVWVRPTNAYSLNNLVAEGFRFVRSQPRQFDGRAHVALEWKVAHA